MSLIRARPMREWARLARDATDPAAAERFREFSHGCVQELCSNYGPIDILPPGRASRWTGVTKILKDLTDLESNMQILNGNWKLSLDPQNEGRAGQWFAAVRPEARPAPVPGVVQQFFPDYCGVTWYWHAFRPERKAERNQRWRLRFGAVNYFAEVWLNGIAVGSHEGGETPFSLDVTKAIRTEGENLLAARVVNPSGTPIDGMRLCEIPSGNGRRYGGIMLPVELLCVPAVRIDDLLVQPEVATGGIEVTVTVVNDARTAAAGTLCGVAGPAMSGEVADSAEIKAVFPQGESTHRLALTIRQHRLWSPDDPQLYNVRVALESHWERNAVPRHEKSVRCGFRDFRVGPDGYFRLNGKRLFLRSMHTAPWSQPGSPGTTAMPAFSRRDMILAKACGFNMIRFIAGCALPEQLDLCDEIGLMIYEESLASWNLADSPDMPRRYDQALREMILRDRNHPCVTIWGLLNEMADCPTHRHAQQSLPLVRSLDTTRLVLLSSGRFAYDSMVGSLANPGSMEWECLWGLEGTKTKAREAPVNISGNFEGAGDVHMYPRLPQSPAVNHFMRTTGKDSKPVFLSEYGIGSLCNAIRELRHFEQAGMSPEPAYAVSYRNIEQRLLADWKRFGMEGVYPFPEDMLRDSQRLHCRQRLLGFDIIRSNPKFCGFSLTSMLDGPVGGEGTWSFWREPKPGIIDALSDGWAPLRWCLFVEPSHVYAGREFKIEAVLANEDVLPSGEYPVTLRITGKPGIVWEKRVTALIPAPADGQEGLLAVSVYCGTTTLDVPTGEYEFAASMDRGGAPAGGRLTFHVTDPKGLPNVQRAVRLFGMDKRIETWLTTRGVRCRQFDSSASSRREVIVVGRDKSIHRDVAAWRALAKRMARGSTVVFTSPESFRRAPAGNLGTVEVVSDIPSEPVAYCLRDFPVANVSAEEQGSFNAEFFGRFSVILSDLPARTYRVEIGMCEGSGWMNECGMRVFDVFINGEKVLENFDIIREAGKPCLAVLREFPARPRNGSIMLKFVSRADTASNWASVSRIRLFDEQGNRVIHFDARSHVENGVGWLPLEQKTPFTYFDDWLYHKECVAKDHPVFDGLQAKGIMDWEYYGPVISHTLFERRAETADVMAAAFAVGYCNATGYASGLMMAEYPFGQGRFIVNTFNILENIDIHPAADRLLLNLINHSARSARGPAAPLPKGFADVLKKIGYEHHEIAEVKQ